MKCRSKSSPWCPEYFHASDIPLKRPHETGKLTSPECKKIKKGKQFAKMTMIWLSVLITSLTCRKIVEIAVIVNPLQLQTTSLT